MPLQRLQKLLSQLGITSRRQAEAMIREGKVRVNGQIAELGQKVDGDHDDIWVNGRRITTQQKQRHYILLNKPLGVVSTCSDPQGRPTVLMLLPPHLRQGSGIHPVGRLDQNSTGALILTNDGELTFCLTHPKHQISKTYDVWVKGHPTASILRQWQRGVLLEGRQTLPAQVLQITPMPDLPIDQPVYSRPMTCLEIVMTEGRNRQIRKVADQLGHPVIHLHRRKIGNIELQNSEKMRSQSKKRWRYLKKDEIKYLKNLRNV